MGEWLTLSTPEGPVQAWLARPETAPLGAVVVIQEIFGVNAHIRSTRASSCATTRTAWPAGAITPRRWASSAD
jgi:carboxymethylenebutenolidase